MSDKSNLPEVGPWAREKLESLGKYAAAYTQIMKKQRWLRGYVFVDAFAGGGRAVVRRKHVDDADRAMLELGQEFRTDEEAREVMDGSPRVTLDIEHPFTHYVFIERDPGRLQMLRTLELEYQGRRSVVIREGDCNEYLSKLVRNPRISWKEWRAVVFLDPFGMQVPWKTIEGLAATKAIEVFLNFPLGMSIQRLLKRSGEFSEREREKLDNYFGDPGWYDVVYSERRGLFGSIQTKADDAGERLVDWYRSRLKQAFGEVSGASLVRNSRGGHLYFLVFAGPNKTGAKIANAILQAGIEASPRKRRL